MTSRAQRRSSRAPAKSRRTPTRPRQQSGTNIPWIPIGVVVAIIAVVGVVVFVVIQSNRSSASSSSKAQKYELDLQEGAPGDYVNLPQAFADGSTLAGYHKTGGAPDTASHVSHDVDYSKETSANSTTGYPPAGGPHWGATSCGSDPANAPAFCGPVPWGVYRAAWHAESLVHNMEHGGVIIWYNSTDTAVRDKIEAEATKYLKKNAFIVVTPYSNMPADTIALTSWARRDEFSTINLDTKRMDAFIEKFNCAFNPEGLSCGKM